MTAKAEKRSNYDPIFSAMRSFALRERGLDSNSSGDAVMGL